MADILLDKRVNADDLIAVLTKKRDRNAKPIILTQRQAIQLLSDIWGRE